MDIHIYLASDGTVDAYLTGSDELGLSVGGYTSFEAVLSILGRRMDAVRGVYVGRDESLTEEYRASLLRGTAQSSKAGL